MVQIIKIFKINPYVIQPPMEMPILYSGTETYILRCTCFHVPCMQFMHPSWQRRNQLFPHKRFPQHKRFFVCPWMNLDWSPFEQLSFCEAAFQHKLSSSCILIGEDFERGYRLLGLLSKLGNLVAPTHSQLSSHTGLSLCRLQLGSPIGTETKESSKDHILVPISPL